MIVGNLYLHTIKILLHVYLFRKLNQKCIVRYICCFLASISPVNNQNHYHITWVTYHKILRILTEEMKTYRFLATMKYKYFALSIKCHGTQTGTEHTL